MHTIDSSHESQGANGQPAGYVGRTPIFVRFPNGQPTLVDAHGVRLPSRPNPMMSDRPKRVRRPLLVRLTERYEAIRDAWLGGVE